MQTSKLLATLSLAVLATPAFAQSPAAADTNGKKLDSIVVTATREPRSLAQVPFAVSIVGKEQWKGRSGIGLDQALAHVPGVFAQSRFGTHDIRITIRGFGARGAGDRSNAGTSRGVRILLDGIPETEPDGRTAFDHIDLATIERVEVLRSNGSAAWGNAAGGIVSLTSMPEFDANFTELTEVSGSHGMLRTIARTGTLLGEAKSWLSLSRTTFSGWREHSDANRTTVLGGIRAPLAAGGHVGVQFAAASNLFRIPGPLTPAQFDADPQQANATYLSRDERRFNRLMRLGVTIDQPIGEKQDVSAMFFVNPKYLQRSERNTFRDFTRYHVGGNSSWGLRFTTGELGHRLRVGGDFAFQDGSIQFYNLGPGNTRGTTLQQNKGEGAQNAGLFVQDELAIGDDVTLLVGARFDDLAYFYRDNIDPTINASRRFSRVTPRGGISWRARPGTTVYASYGAGVEIPAGNETDPPPTGIPDPTTALNPLLDPVRSATVEAGLRQYRAFDNRWLKGLTVDAALYSVSVNGEPVPYNGGRFYLTAGEVSRRGLELSLTGQLAAGVTARFTGTYSKNTYDRYVIDSTYLGAPGGEAVLDGNKVAGLPPRVFNASILWEPTSVTWLSAEFGVQNNHEYYADDKNTVGVPGATVYRAGLNARYTFAGGIGLRGSLAVENLTDEVYVGSAFINPDLVGGAPAVYEAGLPRSIVMTLSFTRSR